MARETFVRRVLALLGVVALASACGSSVEGPGPTPSPPARAPNRLGTFNFTLESRPVAAQADLMASTGYQGVAMLYDPDVLREYRSLPAVADGRLPVMMVLYRLFAEEGVDPAAVRPVMQAILAARALPCVHIGAFSAVGVDRLAAMTGQVADIVRELDPNALLCLYPHAGEPMADVETALDVMLRSGRPNVRLSLHLCHELKAGHQNRLPEVIARVARHVVLATINGADIERERNLDDYSRSIRPLAAGDLDVERLYLRPLLDAGYEGPFILHTFGLSERPEAHLPESWARWRRMISAYFP
jgi:sugar phosphate isomerase/epimerase